MTNTQCPQAIHISGGEFANRLNELVGRISRDNPMVFLRQRLPFVGLRQLVAAS